MKINNIYIIIILIGSILFNSCSGCSHSGRRAKIIAMAKNESDKPSTNPNPNSIIKNNTPKTVNIEDVLTPEEKEFIRNKLINKKIPEAKGDLIQTEGLVLKEVSELTIKLKTSHNQIEQILAMQRYVQNNWHYLYDPNVSGDTWRSAEATLALKYKEKYSGDCDDFAILMASFAKQIGLRSRMIGAFDDNGSGHAFAEFLVGSIDELASYNVDTRRDNGIWVSLDWFKGREHNIYSHNILIYEEI